MKIIEISPQDRQKYDEFVLNHPLGTIHQTWAWGDFQSSLSGRDRSWRLAEVDGNGQFHASALIIRQQLPFGKCWLYSPRGPLVDYSSPAKALPLFEKIASLAREQNAVFFRFDPAHEAPSLSLRGSETTEAISSSKQAALQKTYLTFLATAARLRPAHAHHQPENTLILDLTQDHAALLARMKPKGRYNIKVAQKHGVKIRVSDGNETDIKAFYSLLQQTTTRDQFSGHALSYYANMLKTLGPSPVIASEAPVIARLSWSKPKQSRYLVPHALSHGGARLYLAEYENHPVAGLIATYFKDTATYYFGASGGEHRNVMAPYLLQWQAVQDAKAAGFHKYDFLGIAPENEPNHPWAGVTDFKLKFGGQRINYTPAQEIVYKPFWYTAIRFAKWLKGLRP